MKTALVTGASRGLGEALVVCLANRGYRVHGLVRTPQSAEALHARCAAAMPIIGDVACPEVITAIHEALSRHADGVNLLINNAGSGASIRAMRAGVEEEIAAHVNVHCLGALRVSRAALPFLRRAEPALIVNVSSRFGSTARAAAGLLQGHTLSYAYPIAKAAQNMLTLRMAEELRSSQVRVCAVHPGQVQTASGSPDAITTPTEAAVRLLDWLESAPADLHGCYVDLDTGRQGW
jgi:NAD(P)-dependent dehydrogenase (short-subunit alcohol dehydrogenase family)